MVPNVLIAMTALLGCLALGGLALGAAECPEEWEGDGYCDMTADGTDCNTAEHDWDGGDCCADSAAESDDGHGPWGFECLDPDHQDSYKIRVDYHGYALWMHCNKTQRAGYAYRFKYELLPDTHDYKRKKSGAYIKDKNIPDECQQRQGGTYKGADVKYDRGHIVMAQHLDFSIDSMYDSHYRTNILPQPRKFNQLGGAWRLIEDTVECTRDDPTVARQLSLGGMVYNNADNDDFLKSHGIPTPDIYWRVAVKFFKDTTTQPDLAAWWLPNRETTLAGKVYQKYTETAGGRGYLIDIVQLKRWVADTMPELPDDFTQKALDTGKPWVKKVSKCFRTENDDAISQDYKQYRKTASKKHTYVRL